MEHGDKRPRAPNLHLAAVTTENTLYLSLCVCVCVCVCSLVTTIITTTIFFTQTIVCPRSYLY